MNLTDLLSGSVISSIAGQTGTSEKDTQNVLASALPALVGAMAQNASTEEGAESLARALDDHTTTEGLSGLLGKVDTEDGAKILTKILGGQNDAVQKAVAKKSGASKTDTTKILTMAAPLLLAALGSQKKKTKTKSAGLGSLLTGLLGGGEDDEDDGSTLVSLAGSLLGGSAEKEDGGDLLTSLAGSLLTNALGGGSGKKKKNDSGDLLTSLAGSLLGGMLDTSAEEEKKSSGKKKTSSSGKKTTTSSGKKKTTTGKKTTASGKKTTASGGKKTASAGKKTATAKKSAKKEDDAAELLGSVLGSLLGGKK